MAVAANRLLSFWGVWERCGQPWVWAILVLRPVWLASNSQDPCCNTCPPQTRPTQCLLLAAAERPMDLLRWDAPASGREVLYIFRLSLSTRRSRPLAACPTFPFNQPKLNSLRAFRALPLP